MYQYGVTLFDFGRSNRLSITPVYSDAPPYARAYWWISGRVLGRYISVTVGKP